MKWILLGNARKRVINPNQSFNNGPLNQVSPYFRSAPSVETKGLDRYLYGVPYTHTVLSDSIVQWLMLNLASVHIFSKGRKRKIGRKRTQSLCTAQRDVTLVKEQTNNEISTQKKNVTKEHQQENVLNLKERENNVQFFVRLAYGSKIERKMKSREKKITLTLEHDPKHQ